MSNLKATAIVAALLAVVAIILLLVVPAFQGSEVPGSARNTVSQEAVITTLAPTATSLPTTMAVMPTPTVEPTVPPPTLTPTNSPTLAPTPTTPGVTTNITPTTTSEGAKPPTPTPPNLTAGTPVVVNKDQPELQSSPARSCPQLTNEVLEKVRADYLAYWDALKKAREGANANLVKPYIEISSQGGTFWAAQQQYIDNLVKNNIMDPGIWTIK